MNIRKNSLIKIAAISFLLTIFWSASAFAQIIFQDDFESGDFLKWDFVWRDGQNPAESAEYGLDGQAVTNGGVTIGNITPSTLRHAGNHAYQDHYAMNASGAAHNDNNHMLLKWFNSPTHWFMRAYLYFANDIKWCGATNPGSAGLQRKLIYFKGTNWDTDSSVFGFALGTWSNSGCDGVTLRLGYGGHGGMGGALDNIALLQSGRWYSIEVEVNLATTVGNDTFRLWLDDVLIMERSDLSIQSQSDINGGIGLGHIELGRQVDRYNSNAFDEYRYWDDITVSTTHIGPVDGGSGGDTPPPSSGGDTSSSGGDASGGSGCGFVKNDGKGQKAKGEGLAFAIMLIITLAGIALARRIISLKGFILYKYISVFLTIILVTLLSNNYLNAENTDRTKAESVCSRSDIIICENWEDGDHVDWMDWADTASWGGPIWGGHSCDNAACRYPYPGYQSHQALLAFLTQDTFGTIYPTHYTPGLGANDTVYARWYVRWSQGFEYNTSNNKNFFLFAGNNDYSFFVRPFRKDPGGFQEGIDDPKLASPYIHMYCSQTDAEQDPNYAAECAYSGGDLRYFPNVAGYESFVMKGGPEFYCVEMMVTPNPTGQSWGGKLKFWIDEVLMADYPNVSLRHASDSTPIDRVMISSYWGGGGVTSLHPDQFVVYDNIVVSKSYIGCNGSGGSGNTPPPSSGSGGDSGGGSSGGSGCGFVKEDGKGQGAKGEGLSLMIMLIIALAGIALVRKAAVYKGSKGIEHIKRMICLISYSKCIWLLIMVIASTALVNTSHAAVLVDENFDDSSYADTGWTAWLQNGNCNTGTTMGLNANSAYSGAAGLDIYYHMSNDPNAQGDCQLHQDNNTSLVHTFSPGLSHYFVRGYFRFPFDTSTLCSQPWVQRKLIYFKPQNYNSNGWNFIVNAWPWTNCLTDGYNVSVTYRGPIGSDTYWGNGSPGFFPTNNHLYVNTWYYIEAEVAYGAYGHDTMRIWLAAAGTSPSLIFERTDLTWRSEQDVVDNITLGTIEIGRQVDINRSSFSQGIDEHRYWDEVVISSTPIGPLDGGSSGNTPPPSGGNTGGSGSDSTSSGGSGCGFVRDENSKGQGAKGEGVALMIMLLIALTGIALRRIIAKLKMRRMLFALIKGICFLVVAILLAQIAACGSGGGSDSSNSSNSSSGGSGGGTDNGAATINMVLPQENSVGAALDTYITLQSSAPLNPGTVSASTFYVTAPGNSLITATVSYQNQVVTISPQGLQPLTTYTVVCSSGVRDTNGAAIPSHSWKFTTANTTGSSLPLQGLWESNMVTYGNKWGQFLLSPNNSQDAKLASVYYDGENTFYLIADYLKQQEPWASYAKAAEVVYRDNYAIANSYHLPGFWRFPHGIYQDYVRNGDPVSAAGLVLMRDNPSYSDPDTSQWASQWYYQQVSREIAYAIRANVYAERAGNARTSRMPLYIPMALAHLKEWYTQQFMSPDQTAHFYTPFMFGLTAEALIEYYEWEVEQGHNPDETIPNALKATANYTWTAPVVDQPGKTLWIPDLGGSAPNFNDQGGTGYGGFRYSDRAFTYSDGGTTAPAPALNLLIAPVYAWLYKHYGDPKYRDQGDLIWKGGVMFGAVDWSGKLFNQNYRMSFNYVKWRQEGQAKWGN